MGTNFTTIDTFKFWCQKILPLAYDDSLSYYETLCKLTSTLNKVIENINNIPDYIKELLSDETYYRKKTCAAKKRAYEYDNILNYSEKIEKIYASVANNRIVE